MRKVLSLAALFTVACMALAGCGSGGGGGSNPVTSPGQTPGSTLPVKSIDVAPASPTIQVGQTITLTALGKDQNGAAVATSVDAWSWSVSGSAATISIPTVDTSHCAVTGASVGSATVTVTNKATGVTQSDTVTVVAAGQGGGSNGGGSGSGGSTVYKSDFTKSADSAWSTYKTETSPGSKQMAPTTFLGEFGAGTVNLSLTNLPTHSSVTLTFDLYIIRTMDGNSSYPGLGPDMWSLGVQNGPTLLSTTFSNITPQIAAAVGNFPEGFFQAFPDAYPGGNHPYQTGAVAVNALGFFINQFPDDSIYHLTYTFPSTTSSLQFNFTSAQTQPVTDESWGLNNVVVSVQ